MSCGIVKYSVLFYFIFYYPMTFFMPPTQYSIFGEPLCRRYKGHIFVVYFAIVYFAII